MFAFDNLYACNLCGRADTFSKLCYICETCLRESYTAPPEFFSTVFVKTVLMLEESERIAFAEAFYHMLCEEEDHEFPRVSLSTG